ncbi:hypothetical protein BH20PSE1_BH20PSE1_14210 [soil metagenome]
MKMLKSWRPSAKATLLLGLRCGEAALFMVASALLPAAADNDNDGRPIEVVEPGRTLFKESYNELTGKWSNWLSRVPIATNPALDNDGRFCDRNQRDKVWFLAGTFGGALGENPVADRTCKVPAGKGIFFPMFSVVSFAPDFLNTPPCQDLTEDVAQIRCDVNDDVAIVPNVALAVLLDGKPVADLFAYRVQSKPGGFTFHIAPGSPLTAFDVAPGKREPAVADGYWILLEPPSPGHHTVSFSADFARDVDADGIPDLPDGIPDLGANYELLIGGGRGGDDD